MTTARRSLAAALVAALAAAFVVVGGAATGVRAATTDQASRDVPLPALAAAPTDALTAALARGELTPAGYALERAASIFDLPRARARFGDVAPIDPRAATIVLRDLWIRLDELEGADLDRARSILARPTDDSRDGGGPKYSRPEATPECDANVCVHSVSSRTWPRNRDAARPAFTRTALEVMGKVWRKEIDAFGYRAPKADVSSVNDGGDGRLDVYLADVGGDGLYGYCTSDDPDGDAESQRDVSAYCVLDNDYAGFPYADPTDPLKVTAAHEFHHAVQAAYDWWEDGWLMEGTATWIEDEVFDTIDDNLYFLDDSPLTDPLRPLDRNAYPGWYGTWIWFRFLAEWVGDPGVMLEVWERADASAGAPNRYSTQAIVGALRDWTVGGRTASFRAAFARFGAWNVVPRAFYDEGAKYPPVATQAFATLSGTRRSISSSAILNHLTNRSTVLTRGAGLPRKATLRVQVNAPRSRSGAEASVVVVKRSGGVRLFDVGLDRTGDGARKVAFGSGVARVVVVTTNASTRFSACGSDPRWRYSCAGDPVDDGLRFRFTARVAR